MRPALVVVLLAASAFGQESTRARITSPPSTGTNSGDVTLTAAGSTPNANGASLTGQALTLQPADATNPGLLTAIAQTIAGLKTFSGQILSTVVSGQTAIKLATGAYMSFNTGEGSFIRAAANNTILNMSDVSAASLTSTTGNVTLGTTPTMITVKPTLTSFGGTGASVVGTGVSFDVNVGTVAPGNTGTFTFGATATTGYNCTCWNKTTTTSTSHIKQTATSTTTCAIAQVVVATDIATNWTASDHVGCFAFPY